MAAVIFDSLGFSITIRPWQSFLIFSIIRHVTSYPLKGNIVRVPRKKELSRMEEKGQEYRRITEKN